MFGKTNNPDGINQFTSVKGKFKAALSSAKTKLGSGISASKAKVVAKAKAVAKATPAAVSSAKTAVSGKVSSAGRAATGGIQKAAGAIRSKNETLGKAANKAANSVSKLNKTDVGTKLRAGNAVGQGKLASEKARREARGAKIKKAIGK